MSLRKYMKSVGTVSPRASVTEAARAMRDKMIGAVVVVSDDNQALGLLTDRDVVLRVLAEGRDPERTAAEEVMTRGVASLQIDSSLEKASELMRDFGIRRVPIIDDTGRVAGLVSFDDLILLLGMELGNLAAAIFSGMGARRMAAERTPAPSPT
jgi:CBS domain-containing protein